MSGVLSTKQKTALPFATRPAAAVRKWLWVVMLMVPVVGLYYARLNRVVGLASDDGWYVLLAQSLATGQGFQLMSSPLTGILPSYPPAFPALLSIFLRLLPAWVESLWMLKFVSVAAMMGVGVSTYVYLVRLRQLSDAIAALLSLTVVLMPAFVFLATSTLMSECVFTLAQLLTVLVVERALQRKEQARAWLWWWAAAMLASGTFLTRSIAVSLLFAVVLYLAKERTYKAALIFSCGSLLFIGPWLYYTRANATAAELKETHGGNIVYGYTDQLWMKYAGISNSGTETVRDLPGRIWRNTYDIATRDFCGMVFPSLLRTSPESGEEIISLGETKMLGGGGMRGVPATAIISSGLCLCALLGFAVTARRRITLTEILIPCSLAVIVIWPWWTFRFVLPLAPFLLYYLAIGLLTIRQSAQKLLRSANATAEWSVVRVLLFCVLGLYAYDHIGYVRSQLQNPESSGWISEYNESMETLEWVRTSLPADAIVASNRPVNIFLHTGRKAVACDQVLENWERWKRVGVRYIVVLVSHGATPLDEQEQTYPVLYRSANGMRVIDLGDPISRPTPQR
jgi:hypothetical protein